MHRLCLMVAKKMKTKLGSTDSSKKMESPDDMPSESVTEVIQTDMVETDEEEVIKEVGLSEYCSISLFRLMSSC